MEHRTIIVVCPNAPHLH